MYSKITLLLVLTTLILTACSLPGSAPPENPQLASAEKTLAALEQQIANAQQVPPTERPAPIEIEDLEPSVPDPDPVVPSTATPTATPAVASPELQERSGDPLIYIDLDDGVLIKDNGCDTVRQDMNFFGAGLWRFDDQIFGRGLNCDVSFNIGVDKTGLYEIVLIATHAPDFGTLQVTLIRGTVINQVAFELDLFGPDVRPTERIELGKWALTAGEETQLIFAVTGKNPASSEYAFGLDYIELLPITRAP